MGKSILTLAILLNMNNSYSLDKKWWYVIGSGIGIGILSGYLASSLAKDKNSENLKYNQAVFGSLGGAVGGGVSFFRTNARSMDNIKAMRKQELDDFLHSTNKNYIEWSNH